MAGIITLVTDFGGADTYVAEVKAALLAQAPGVVLVDITHEVPAGDVRAAQYLLGRAWHRFPPDSVHLAVVDPGVGTVRRALAAQAGDHFFVAPDNGLLSFLPSDARFVRLRVPPEASATFHGRDVFAPAAARLARGTALEHLGPQIADPVRNPLPIPVIDGATIVGVVVHLDRFGTLITNIPGDRVPSRATVQIAGRECGPVRGTFADVSSGSLLAYVGSDGAVEVAVRDGNAARELGATVGAVVHVLAGR